jgi:ClpP class serine protease
MIVTNPWTLDHQWAMARPQLDTVAGFLAKGEAQAAAARPGVRAGVAVKQVNGVSVIDLAGVLMKHDNWLLSYLGGTPLTSFAAAVDQAAADSAVRGIVVRVESPGGTVAGAEAAG